MEFKVGDKVRIKSHSEKEVVFTIVYISETYRDFPIEVYPKPKERLNCFDEHELVKITPLEKAML